MADLTDIQAGMTVKIAGANPSTGVEDNFAEVDANGRLQMLAFQGTSPWVVSGSVALTEDHNWGAIGANTLRVAAELGNANGAADFNAGNTSAQTLRVVVATNQTSIPVTGTFWQAIQPVSGTVAVTQSTSPWVVSGTVALSEDHNWGTVGATTLRTASQMGNANGAAAFGAGTTNGQVLRVVLPTDQTSIPAAQSGTWTTGRTWTLASGTDSVSCVQSTSPWVVSGTVTANEDKNWGAVGANTLRTASQMGNANGAADFNAGNTSAQTLRVVIATNQSSIPVTGTFWQAIQPVSGTVAVTQSTSPWVVSGTVALSEDHNWGTVGATTLRTASQLGNSGGAADFNAGATGAQTLRTVANQGAPNTLANAWPSKITDGTNTAAVSTNHDVGVSDGLHGSGVYGNLALTTANTAYEVKVGGSRLTGRKSLTIMPIDADMYWGYSSSVTTSNGTPIFRNQFQEFSLDANDATVQVWLVCATASKNARITESP